MSKRVVATAKPIDEQRAIDSHEASLPESVLFVIRELAMMSNAERLAVAAWVNGGGCVASAARAYKASR